MKREAAFIVCQALDGLVPQKPHYEGIIIRPVLSTRMLDLREVK